MENNMLDQQFKFVQLMWLSTRKYKYKGPNAHCEEENYWKGVKNIE